MRKLILTASFIAGATLVAGTASAGPVLDAVRARHG